MWVCSCPRRLCDTIYKAVNRVGLQIHDEVRATCDAETETLGVRLRLDADDDGSAVVVVSSHDARGRVDGALINSWAIRLLHVFWHGDPCRSVCHKLARAAYQEPLGIWNTVRK